MGMQCLKCKEIISGTGGLHTFSECPKCGNKDKDQFIRVDDTDIDPKAKEKDKEWLESRKTEKKRSKS